MSSTSIESADYSASEMSDGERAVFYILGQVLSANEGSILIFDEPELHIHKSIISNLWDEIEKLRPDCRKPILFVEGEKTSLDMETYCLCYPEWTVIPKGSCKDVIQAVSSLRKLNEDMPILNIKCAGIVDRDTHDSSQIEELEGQGIKVLRYSEIENIFSLPSIAHEVLKIVGFTGNELTNRQEQFNAELLSYIKNELSGDKLEKFVVQRIHRKIDTYLKRIDLSDTKNSDDMKDKLISEVSALINSKINEWISEMKNEIQKCIDNENIDGLLYIYENKGLLAKTASILMGISKSNFEGLLMRKLKEPNNSLLQAIKSVLPELN